MQILRPNLWPQNPEDNESVPRLDSWWDPEADYPNAEEIPCNVPSSALTMPPLEQPIEASSDWVVMEDDFHLVYAVNASFIGATVKFAPEATTDDGRMWLIIIRKGVSRTGMARFGTSMDSGNHLSLSGVEVRQVDALRIEPLPNDNEKSSKPGHITVDGELLDYEALQAELLPSFIRVSACPIRSGSAS